jgi:gas vesicle protein
MKPVSSFISGLLAGVAIGGVIALLYAPKSGKETREQVKRKYEELEKEFMSLKGKAGQKTDKIKEDIAKRLAELQREIENLSKVI